MILDPMESVMDQLCMGKEFFVKRKIGFPQIRGHGADPRTLSPEPAYKVRLLLLCPSLRRYPVQFSASSHERSLHRNASTEAPSPPRSVPLHLPGFFVSSHGLH